MSLGAGLGFVAARVWTERQAEGSTRWAVWPDAVRCVAAESWLVASGVVVPDCRPMVRSRGRQRQPELGDRSLAVAAAMSRTISFERAR